MLKDGSETDAQKLISLVFSMLKDGNIDRVDEKIVRNFAFGARAVLNPMAAMFGGIVGQEVVKVCSGKFHPLLQPATKRIILQFNWDMEKAEGSQF
ncbi:putative ubiquitin-activating enzyme [Helianthus annuus]|uniref:Ubiquitin-activating enzyme n=1 Tax=Helianthus annuus TaxID=4232 RepID=A0A9K3HPY2_HELAN|nr:putative ubiquitin-activating enzyme [Helianthus annuus]KAJ0502016.1 putative ubiquitin-activating enzyme [Helianthus annuus]KAJ0509969.1 putative ubiquitin-activating enzyme [Helianthus annuus]KAJ0517940.1 putative ubiquitin-activating enzyme [Helianthus annuus]KAJ0685960.1 putative ubiquitin-activating enzyme [Helianthus annuus]